MVATTAFYAPLHALEDMSSRLIQIDTQMTEIDRILGGMNKLQLNDLLQTAIDESDQLKNKLSDTLDIMAEFATMGYKSEDLGNLSKVAQIMTNISGLDAKSAVDSLVSAMVNFNIQTKDAMSIEDKFSKVDQNFAVTTLDLAQGIQKAGASAKTFGVDIDSLNGYITAIAQSTRESGSVIGKELLI
jgi:TP901 family phage tail tape measure protein